MKKILIIGPIYPWRGGISHSVGQMATDINQQDIVCDVLSFSFMYPKFFYPGRDQKEKGINPYPGLHVVYKLHPLNPISWYRTYNYIINGGYDVCIFKYWHFYFTPCFIFIAYFLKKRGIKTVCVIDNLLPHEKGLLSNLLFFLVRIFFHFVDIFVTQSEFVASQFQGKFPHKMHFYIPHPLYTGFGPKLDKNFARNALSLKKTDKLILFFGFIRDYKGLDILLSSIPGIFKQISDLKLLIVGECFGSFKKYQRIIDEAGIAPHVILRLGYVKNEDIRFYFSAADSFIMPYRGATNSGVMEIAKYYNLPIVLSDIDAFSKIRGDNFFHANIVDVFSLYNAITESFLYKKYSFDICESWSSIFISNLCLKK